LSTFFVVFVFAEQEEVVEEEVVKEEEDNESRIVGARSARERRSERIEVSTSTALFLFFFYKVFDEDIDERRRLDETKAKGKKTKKLTEINPKLKKHHWRFSDFNPYHKYK
tara:strand:- start:56 stop:388 length:333 start_codon:yes stop_codon:yes gene_type:complete